jgi:hypothetical protein
MQDRTHNDVGAKLQAIVDDGIAELLLLGMESRDAAAEMMACQAAVRIEDNEVVRRVAHFVDELVWDVDDTKDPGGGA